MRKDIEDHFGKPGAHLPETHQVWNYWHIPELYTYLRTDCDKVIKRAHILQFMAALTKWAVRTIGMEQITWPYSSSVCQRLQARYSADDSTNGRFAFVYSLTRTIAKRAGVKRSSSRRVMLFAADLPSLGLGLTFTI